MTLEEKAEAKRRAITYGVLVFVLLSAILWGVGTAFLAPLFNHRFPLWFVALITLPIAYFVAKRDFDRKKRVTSTQEMRKEK